LETNYTAVHLKKSKLHQNLCFAILGLNSDPIRVPRIENWVTRIIENYHRVPRIRENRVPRIREIGSLQVHTRYLKKKFSLKKPGLSYTLVHGK